MWLYLPAPWFPTYLRPSTPSSYDYFEPRVFYLFFFLFFRSLAVYFLFPPLFLVLYFICSLPFFSFLCLLSFSFFASFFYIFSFFFYFISFSFPWLMTFSNFFIYSSFLFIFLSFVFFILFPFYCSIFLFFHLFFLYFSLIIVFDHSSSFSSFIYTLSLFYPLFSHDYFSFYFPIFIPLYFVFLSLAYVCVFL